MRYRYYLGFLLLSGMLQLPVTVSGKAFSFDFYGRSINFDVMQAAEVNFPETLSRDAVLRFYGDISATDYAPILAALHGYRNQNAPDDWLYYQLVRQTAQQLSPKAENYYRYTLYKWFLLTRSGYDATLKIAGDQLLFYVQSDENIYDIPSYFKDGRQYICLNYHDYKNIDLAKTAFIEVPLAVAGSVKSFSYKLTTLPDFRPGDYEEKSLAFEYNNFTYRFKIKLNPQIRNIFANYPVADYQFHFNTPLSRETYETLIPQLKKNITGLSVKSGVNYLMRFTRYAFPYQPDAATFGREKRLSPEQTLLYAHSDCEDRAALFFYLVREIYDLPMIVLAFPDHVTIAVKLSKPAGDAIIFNGDKYYVCEPTPQADDLPIGKLSRELRSTPYEVVYAYHPHHGLR
jgi:hypothetical protein